MMAVFEQDMEWRLDVVKGNRAPKQAPKLAPKWMVAPQPAQAP